MQRIFIVFIISFMVMCNFTACLKNTEERDLKKFIQRYEEKMIPLSTAHGLAEWNAYTTGKQIFFDEMTELSLKIDSIHQIPEDFHFLKGCYDRNDIRDPLLKRQIDVLYRLFLEKQIDPQLNKAITSLASKVEGVFANYRTRMDGKILSDNQVTQILKTERNSARREKVWRAQKSIGDSVAGDIIQLARLRNQAARQLGYVSYFQMAMDISELSPEKVENIFDELYDLSEAPFREINARINKVFASRFGITADQIRPWHYEDLFAQDAPSIFDVDLDTYYKNSNIAVLAKRYYASLNMPVDDILERSDLYERPGKSQHAFSFCIDRKSDIRILCNLIPDMRWMETILHELGHATYDKYLDPDLPFVLREPAHAFTTEGIAMMFGGFAMKAPWMARALDLDETSLNKIEEITRSHLRMSKIIFARWSMVIFNFEKELYRDPEQDLGKLWWDLVKKYQLINPPESSSGHEWATKIHIATYPVYYQNYQLGELFASQVLKTVADKFQPGRPVQLLTLWNMPEAGQYIREKIYRPGKREPWNKMIERATGAPLSAKAFAELYVH